MRKRKPTPLEWQALHRLMALHTETTHALANMLGEFISVLWVDRLTRITYWPLRITLEDTAWEIDRVRYRDLFSQNGPEHALARDIILKTLNDRRPTMPEGGFETGEPGNGSHLQKLIEELKSGSFIDRATGRTRPDSSVERGA